MVWAAIAKGFKSRLHIYDSEDIPSIKDQQEIITQANTLLKKRTQARQEAAHHSDTEEFSILQAVNANIQQQNIDEGHSGRHRKRPRKAEQLFKERPVPFRITQGGVNWSVYRQTVCEEILYPFVQEIKAATGFDTIYLVEDNAPCHQTVQRVDKERRQGLGLHTLKWPSNSPDLNKIERCWDPMKNDISTYQFIGASMETVASAQVVDVRSYYSLA